MFFSTATRYNVPRDLFLLVERSFVLQGTNNSETIFRDQFGRFDFIVFVQVFEQIDIVSWKRKKKRGILWSFVIIFVGTTDADRVVVQLQTLLDKNVRGAARSIRWNCY